MRRTSRYPWLTGIVSAVGLLMLLSVEVHSQFPPPPLPAPALPPLMYVRLAGPKGMKITVYRGHEAGRTLDAPATLGLRPGYHYRLALSDIPGFPGQLFFPALEVRGSLLLPAKLRHADFPATLNFYEEDFARVQAGALVKKVVTLERPDLAIPQATTPEQPLEIIVPPPGEPLIEAQKRGQPLVVAQLGQRFYTPEELTQTAIPGTMLLPGEQFLAFPRFAPQVAWSCFPVLDPMVGATHPSELISIFDGGDIGLPAGVMMDGRIRGLDPTDTVAVYTDGLGRRKLVPSNRVSLCIPRYVITRGEINLAAQIALAGPGATRLVLGQELLHTRLILAEQTRRLHLEAAMQKQRPSGTIIHYGTSIVGKIQGTQIKTTLAAINVVDGVCLKPEKEAPPDCPLCIIKWPDRAGALVGELVTFHLRYTNQENRPISDVVVTDNLTARFEYVPGSARTDREALFTIQPNNVGSSILHWEIAGELPPGESGLITFQVRVR